LTLALASGRPAEVDLATGPQRGESLVPPHLLADSVLGYALVVASIAGSAVFPPLPSESMLAAVMGLAATGRLQLGLVCASTTLGAVLGDLAAYGVGRFIDGRARKRTWGTTTRAAAALGWLQDHGRSWGPGLIVIGRFIPGGTTAVGLTSGLLRYPIRRYLACSGIGASLWTGYGLAVGFLGRAVFGHNSFAAVALAIGIAIGLGLLFQFAHRLKRPTVPER
jgi:membrane protein DedA with SNARE-associated domain